VILVTLPRAKPSPSAPASAAPVASRGHNFRAPGANEISCAESPGLECAREFAAAASTLILATGPVTTTLRPQVGQVPRLPTCLAATWKCRPHSQTTGIDAG